MIASAARSIGKIALLAVSLTVITGVSLLLFGSYLLTWPVLRLSPRDRRVRSLVDLASAAFAALAAMQTPSASDDTEIQYANGLEDRMTELERVLAEILQTQQDSNGGD